MDRRYLSTASGHCKFLIPGRCLVDRVNVNSHVFMPMRFFSSLLVLQPLALLLLQMFVNESERLITLHRRKRVLILVSSKERFFCTVFSFPHFPHHLVIIQCVLNVSTSSVDS